MSSQVRGLTGVGVARAVLTVPRSTRTSCIASNMSCEISTIARAWRAACRRSNVEAAETAMVARTRATIKKVIACRRMLRDSNFVMSRSRP